MIQKPAQRQVQTYGRIIENGLQPFIGHFWNARFPVPMAKDMVGIPHFMDGLSQLSPCHVEFGFIDGGHHQAAEIRNAVDQTGLVSGQVDETGKSALF
jgi:hypothetical protein